MTETHPLVSKRFNELLIKEIREKQRKQAEGINKSIKLLKEEIPILKEIKQLYQEIKEIQKEQLKEINNIVKKKKKAIIFIDKPINETEKESYILIEESNYFIKYRIEE